MSSRKFQPVPWVLMSRSMRSTRFKAFTQSLEVPQVPRSSHYPHELPWIPRVLKEPLWEFPRLRKFYRPLSSHESWAPIGSNYFPFISRVPPSVLRFQWVSLISMSVPWVSMSVYGSVGDSCWFQEFPRVCRSYPKSVRVPTNFHVFSRDPVSVLEFTSDSTIVCDFLAYPLFFFFPTSNLNFFHKSH